MRSAAAQSAAATAAVADAPTADGYRGIWFTLGQFGPHGDKYSGGLGTYTANHNPIAVYAPAVDKTFFVYGGTTAADQRHLLIMASYYDHKRGGVPRPVIVHDKEGVNDPHDNASLCIDPDGHLWVFVSGRGRARPGFKYRSTLPYSVRAFERVETYEATYPQPWWVPGHGILHLLTRYTKGRELYFEPGADKRKGAGPVSKLAGFGGHYQVSGLHAPSGKVATFFNYHPGGNVDKRTNLYYLQTTDRGGTWTTADGKPVPVPLDAVKNPALVVDYAARGLLQYTCDLNFDEAGNPVLLYVTSKDSAAGPAGDPRTWTVAVWTGKAWETHAVCRSDHNYDMGSLYTEDPRRWRVLGPTEPGPQPYGTGGEMALWVSGDRGRTWRRERVLTKNSPRNHAYARRPKDARDPFSAFWADGDPGKFGVSHLYFSDAEGKTVRRLPYDMKGDFATPEKV